MKYLIFILIIIMMGVLFGMIVLLMFIPRVSQAKEVNNVSYGENITWWQNMNSGRVKCKMLEVEVRDDLLDWLDIGIVGNALQTDIKEGHIIDGNYFEGRDTTFIFSGRLSGYKMLLGNLYGRVYTGIGLNTNRQFPEFGDSGIIGHFGLSLGYNLGPYEVGYGLSHWSDPLRHGDKGHNFQYLSMSIKW